MSFIVLRLGKGLYFEIRQELDQGVAELAKLNSPKALLE
jgi:hypothetical protein